MPLLYEEESYAILGACFEVYKEKGPGFLEGVYHECLMIEFGLRGIPFESKKKLVLTYKDVPLTQAYEPDFICYDKIIVEIKAVTDLHDIFRAKLHHYLKSTKLRLGFLVNFAHYPQLEHERVVY
jgi:GxxExxY protein